MGSELTPEYVATLRRMTGEQKLAAASAIYWAARRLKAAALREQHPYWTADRIEQNVSDLFLRSSGA